GAISLSGTLALMAFGGLALGLLAGAIWVIVSPWVPGRGVRRALLTAIAAIALGTPVLIQGTNPDFAVLDRDPLVVGLLVGLVGMCTATWWILRAKGRSAPPTALRLGAAVWLLLAGVLSVATGLPHILAATGAQ